MLSFRASRFRRHRFLKRKIVFSLMRRQRKQGQQTGNAAAVPTAPLSRPRTIRPSIRLRSAPIAKLMTTVSAMMTVPTGSCSTDGELLSPVYGSRQWRGELQPRYHLYLEYPVYSSGSYYYAKSCTIVDGNQQCNVGVYETGTTTYTTADVTVTGNASSGYDLNYTLTDDDGNAYTVSFTGLTLCDDGHIGSGSGTIDYNGEQIDIEFISCDEFTVTHDGTTETFDQN